MVAKDRLRHHEKEDIPWKMVLIMTAIMLLVGVGTALVSTHKHISGVVEEVGESYDTDWEYLLVYGDSSDFIVYNIFPNSPKYKHNVGDDFNEWVPDGLWVEF